MRVEQVWYGAEEATSYRGQDTIAYKNIPLKIIISDLSDKNTALIESNAPDKLQTVLNLYFKSYQNGSAGNYNDTILKHLKRNFNFSMHDTLQIVDVQTLEIIDFKKLMKNKSSAPQTRISQKRNETVLIKCDLKTLANVITSKTHRLTLSDSLDGYFDFSLPNGNTEKLKANLRTKYGIVIRTRKKEEEVLKVRFISSENQ